MNTVEEKQKLLYDRLSSEYERHYYDTYSRYYRRHFINDPMLKDVDLRGKLVLEAMCGGGYTTDYLLEKGAEVIGLDISERMIELFKQKWPSCKGVCRSIFNTEFPDEYFDAVVVVGGLHHLHPKVEDAVEEIYRILKPGGYFAFMEPHAGSFFDIFRKIWYRLDKKIFEENEAAVDVPGLLEKFKGKFEVEVLRYMGSIAYLLVYNSMVFRIPHSLKRFYSRPLIELERITNKLLGFKLTTCYAVARWKKI